MQTRDGRVLSRRGENEGRRSRCPLALTRAREGERGWRLAANRSTYGYSRSKEDMRSRVGGGQVHSLREHEHSNAEMRENLSGSPGVRI